MEKILTSCMVVLTAGGESSRFKNVEGAAGVQKSAYVLPSGETMIERTIAMYKSVGITRFAVLLYHNAESVEKLLGDGSRLGVTITYSHDPERPVGRGGAIKYAFMNGILSPEDYLIVHNPDDQLVGDPKETLKKLFESHLAHEKSGSVATAVMVDGVRHEFTGFTIEDGFVKDVEMYPFIKIPTHVGITIFSPGMNTYFDALFDLAVKTDFEAVLFPVLVREGKLSAHIIAEGMWISVNDEKGLKKLIKALAEGK